MAHDHDVPTFRCGPAGVGFLSEAETEALAVLNVVIPCPRPFWFHPGSSLAKASFFGPEPSFRSKATGRLSGRRRQTLHPGTRIVAAGAEVSIGAGSEIGEEGGFTIKSGAGGIVVGRNVRLLGGGSLTLANRIGDGAQILGRSGVRIAVWEAANPFATRLPTSAGPC